MFFGVLFHEFALNEHVVVIVGAVVVVRSRRRCSASVYRTELEQQILHYTAIILQSQGKESNFAVILDCFWHFVRLLIKAFCFASIELNKNARFAPIPPKFANEKQRQPIQWQKQRTFTIQKQCSFGTFCGYARGKF